MGRWRDGVRLGVDSVLCLRRFHGGTACREPDEPGYHGTRNSGNHDRAPYARARSAWQRVIGVVVRAIKPSDDFWLIH